MATAPPLLELRGIVRRFGATLANDGIDLRVAAGEVVALLGENGAGKSTLARIASGADRPDAGAILVDGRAVALRRPADAAALGIGAVQQQALLAPALTVAENLLLGGPALRRPARGAVAARLAATGLAIDPHALAGALSLAEQRQVEIVRALWRGGRLILLDEPTAPLGPAAGAELAATIRRLRRDGVAVALVTHSLDEARAVADRIVVLRRGRKVAELGADASTDDIRALMFGARQGTPACAGAPDPLPAGDPALRVQSLSLGPLRDIAFTVAAGEILGVAGIEGHGQRELVDALSGRRPPDSGRIALRGVRIERLGIAARQALGLRHVSDDRLGEGSVGGFPLALNLLLKRIGAPPFWRGGVERRGPITAHARRLAAAFDVRAGGAWAAMRTLSGGNVQKAILARELDGAPAALLLHKPCIGLDLASAEAVRRRIARAAAGGVACVIVSSDLDELLALAHRIAVLRHGRLAGVVPAGPGAAARVAALMTGAA